MYIEENVAQMCMRCIFGLVCHFQISFNSLDSVQHLVINNDYATYYFDDNVHHCMVRYQITSGGYGSKHGQASIGNLP